MEFLKSIFSKKEPIVTDVPCEKLAIAANVVKLEEAKDTPFEPSFEGDAERRLTY